MKRKFAVGVIVVMVIIFIIGIVLIFTSSAFGENAANLTLHNNGGTMDTEQFKDIINATVNNFRIFGAILAMFGGAGILLSGYTIYKEL